MIETIEKDRLLTLPQIAERIGQSYKWTFYRIRKTSPTSGVLVLPGRSIRLHKGARSWAVWERDWQRSQEQADEQEALGEPLREPQRAKRGRPRKAK